MKILLTILIYLFAASANAVVMYVPTDPLNAALGLSSGHERGQSFLSEDGTLQSVDLFLNRGATFPVGDVDLSIRAGTSFSNPALAVATLSTALAPIGNLSNGDGASFVTVDFSTSGLVFTAGVLHTIWLSKSALVLGWWGNTGNPYADGQAFTFGSGIPFGTADLGFRVVSSVPEPSTLALLAAGLLGLFMRRKHLGFDGLVE